MHRTRQPYSRALNFGYWEQFLGPQGGRLFGKIYIGKEKRWLSYWDFFAPPKGLSCLVERYSVGGHCSRGGRVGLRAKTEDNSGLPCVWLGPATCTQQMTLNDKRNGNNSYWLGEALRRQIFGSSYWDESISIQSGLILYVNPPMQVHVHYVWIPVV